MKKRVVAGGLDATADGKPCRLLLMTLRFSLAL